MDLDSVDDLIDQNPIDETSVEAAAKEWRENSPDPQFANLLDAEEVEG
jgi:hypothetical protein